MGSVGVWLTHARRCERVTNGLDYSRSVLDGQTGLTAVRRLEARRAGSDACARPGRNSGQHPHRRHPPIFRR